MNRRTFLARCAVMAALTAAAPWDRRAAAQAASASVTLTIEPERIGPPIAPDFLGLSYESSQVSQPDFFNPTNRSLLGLIRQLGSRGILRIGGNTSEFTRFQADGPAPVAPRVLPPRAKPTTITPDDVQRLGAFVRATGWRLIYGLNLGTGTPAQAAAEAAAVAQALGDSLLAFQIGNEPDLFGHNGLRPKTYTFTDYLREWRVFAQAIHARVPDAPLAGPDTASRLDWFGAMSRQNGASLVLLTQHYYAEGPGSSPASTIDRMLRSRDRLAGILSALQAAALQSGRPWRMAETNSCYGGGRYGVSDTLAAALWGLATLFQLADAGAGGANFHGGPTGAYTPIARVPDTLDFAPRPLLYGLLLFAQAARGHLVPAHLSGAPAGLTTYAARDGDTLCVTCINTDATQPVSLRIDPGRHFGQGDILRLAGPSLGSTAGITLGGTAIGPDGSWPPSALEGVSFNGPQVVLEVPTASAAAVFLH